MACHRAYLQWETAAGDLAFEYSVPRCKTLNLYLYQSLMYRSWADIYPSCYIYMSTSPSGTPPRSILAAPIDQPSWPCFHDSPTPWHVLLPPPSLSFPRGPSQTPSLGTKTLPTSLLPSSNCRHLYSPTGDNLGGGGQGYIASLGAAA